MGATGGITINGRSMTLTSAVTSHGGAVTITLGTGATNIYANGAAGNGFTTTNQNLTLTAGSVTVTGGVSEKLFDLGTADFRDGSLSRAVLDARHTTGKTILVWDGVGTAPTVTTGTEELHTLAEFATKYLPTGLAASNITAASSAPALVTTAITDSLTFVGGSFTGAVALTLDDDKSFSFKGNNSFSDTLSLTTTGTGTITQVGGSSLQMAAGKALSISADGLVNLGEETNQITTINGLTSGGLLTLTTTTDLSIGGTISTSGMGAASAITINAVSLTLSSDVTATGGDATITVSGAFNNAGHKWTTGGKNVTIRFGSVNVTGVAFDIGAGSFTQRLTGGYSKQVGVYTAGMQDTTDTSYEWRTLLTLTNAKGFDAANVTITTGVGGGTFNAVTGGQLKDQVVTFFGVSANSDLVIDAKAVLFKNANSFTNLTITTYGTSGAGSVTQAAGSSVTVLGKLTVSAATGSDLTLDLTNNSIASLGAISANAATIYLGGASQATSLTDTITVTTDLSLLGRSDLTLGKTGGLSMTTTSGTISLSGRKMTLTSDVTANGGAVTIDLNNGEFNDINSANLNDRFTWTSNNQNVTVKNLGTLTTRTAASQKAFALGSGNFIQEGSSGVQITKAKVLVVKAPGEDLADLFAPDIYQTIIAADLSSSSGARFASTDVTTTGTVTIPAAGLNLTDKHVSFYRVRTNATAAVGSATFYGENQLGGLTTTSVTLTDGAVLLGNYSLKDGTTITIGSFAQLKGVISNQANSTLTLNLTGDYSQSLDGGSFNIQGGTFKVVGNSYNINLSNPANLLSSTATLSVDTNGGNFQLATGSNINSTSLKTGGGSVVLQTGGSIRVSGLEAGLEAGRVSFRAGGSVNLAGFFAGAEGSGSSIVLGSTAAGLVIGGLAASSSVTLNGSGTAVLTGDIVASGSADIGQQAVVAGSVSIISTGGSVNLAAELNAAAASLANSLLISVGGGAISLGGSLGKVTRLGWVELEGARLNSAAGVSISWFDGSGNPTLSESKPRWRNGVSF